MTQVVLQNLSDGPKVFHDLDRRAFTLKPGEKRGIEMATHHIRLFERDAQKQEPRIAIDMSATARKEYEKDLADLEAANREARLKGRLVSKGRTVKSRERMPPVDRRFITDPQTVHPPLMDTVTDTSPIPPKLGRSKVVPPKTKTATTQPVKAPAPAPKPERVAMKKKKE